MARRWRKGVPRSPACTPKAPAQGVLHQIVTRSLRVVPGHGPCRARWIGFDLHAAVVVPPRDRARLERLCRDALWPPVAHDRIHLTSDGQVALDLRHDGTDDAAGVRSARAARAPGGADAAAADQSAAVLGVLGARAAWRSRIAASHRKSSDVPVPMSGDHVLPAATDRPKTNWLWADLMQRFGFDVLVCPRCGDRLELIELIEDPRVIRRILSHLACRPRYRPPAPRVRRPCHSGDPTRGPTTISLCRERVPDTPANLRRSGRRPVRQLLRAFHKIASI
jgi:hypothetical protein